MVVALAGPPTDFTVGVFLGLAGFAAALEHVPAPAAWGSSAASSTVGAKARWWRKLRGAPVGIGFGFGVCIVSLRFVPDVVARFTPLPWAAGLVALVLLALAQGLPWGIAGVIAKALGRAGVPRPMAFAAGVYAATFAPAVFPWTPAGLVTPWPAMVQLADAVGERGLAMIFALVAGLVGITLADAAQSRFLRRHGTLGRLVLAALLAGSLHAYGAFRMRSIASRDGARARKTARVALVQPSVPAKVRWDPERAASILATLTALTREAEAAGATLTVWHETAYPYALAASSRRCPTGEGSLLGPGVHGPVLTGLLMTAGPGDAYNAAAVCSAGDLLSEPYAKQKLLAFGESVPLAEYVPWLRRIFVRGLGMIPGARNVVLTSGDVRASVLICFEDILSPSARSAMSGDPNLLVNLTNDAWFEGSAESELHLRLSALRAIEVRRDLVRAVNFGPTTWIDATGRVRASRALDAASAPHVLLAEPILREDPPTAFARFGDKPVVVAITLAIVATLAHGRRRPRHVAR